jgi:hypothetical protein
MRLGFQFIRYTGLRRKDAVEITTAADHGGMTLQEKFETPPVTTLFNRSGRPWTADGFSASFNKQRARHDLAPTIHGLRKNAATDWIIYQNQRPD